MKYLSSKQKQLIMYLVIILLLFLDLFSKLLFCFYLSNFNCVLNTGSAWSLFSSFQHYAFLIGILGIIISIYLLLFQKKIIEESNKFIFCLLIAGILGNSLNRIFFFGVHDMFSISFLPIFGIFNIADIYINLGILLFIILELKKLIFITK